MRTISAERFNRAARGFVVASFIACLATAAETVPIPDFSGVWGRTTTSSYEFPAMGPSPLSNTRRGADATSDAWALVGDDTNPILKPFAAKS